MGKTFFETTNPATGKALTTYHYLTNCQIQECIQKSWKAYLHFKNKTTDLKIEQLQKLAKALRHHKSQMALLMTQEMGKSILDSETEIEKCAGTAEFFAGNLIKFLADQAIPAQYPKSLIVKNSLGPVLAVMPWNFPMWQIIRVLVPAIGVGNPILLKHSDITAGTAQLLQKICDEIEPGLLIHMLMSHEQAAQVIADPLVRAVTLTGSAKAGREIAQIAGKNLKKTVLELGGSDAYIVLEDADIDKAAKICAQSRLVNNGQSCIAAKRFLVQQPIFESFSVKFFEELQKFSMGDPENRQNKLGSLASKKFQKSLLAQCEMLESLGAKKIFDADEKFSFSAADAYFPARAYKIEKELPEAHNEELFGPVALLFPFVTDEEAIRLANQSVYGLGGAVFSKDLARAEKIGRLLESGMVAINDQVKSDARMPFGGVKDSGYGRELSEYGINEFSNIKSLGINS